MGIVVDCRPRQSARGNSTTGTVPVIGLHEVKVGKLYEALNKNF